MAGKTDVGAGTDTAARSDNLLVLAVGLACLALLLGAIAVGFSAEASARSKDDLRTAQATLAAASAVKPAGSAPTSVAITEHDFALAPSVASAPGGLIDFTVHNLGPSQHELLIFRTDLPPDKLPLGSDGRVDESSDNVPKVFDSGNNIPVDGTQTFNTALTPGRYVLVCNLPGHYLAGMHVAFVVN
jgi:uncharacterized cupredoxin-like copper-binding protein